MLDFQGSYGKQEFKCNLTLLYKVNVLVLIFCLDENA